MSFNIKNIIASLISVFVVSMALVTSSYAGKPKFRLVEIGGGINDVTIQVEQQDGRWNRITDRIVDIPFHINIQMSRGYIVRYRFGRILTNGIVFDAPISWIVYDPETWTLNNASSNEYVVSARRVHSTRKILRIGRVIRLNTTDEQNIVSRCNARLRNIQSGHTFSYTIPLALHVDAKRRRRRTLRGYLKYKGFGKSARKAVTGFKIVRVQCLGGVQGTPLGPSLGFDQGNMRVLNLKHFLVTYANQTTSPNPATRCKKAKLIIRAETNNRGRVPLRIFRQFIGYGIRSVNINPVAQHDGNGRFFARYEQWITVPQTRTFQANIRDLTTEGFYKETGWKKITLRCRGVGQGGLQVAPQGDDNGLPSHSSPQSQSSGQLQVAPKKDDKKVPLGSIKRTKCIGGINNRRGMCICRKGMKKQRVARGIYKCVRKAKHRVQCIKGRLRRNNCVCPRGWRKVLISRKIALAKVYKCVKNKPTRVNPTKPTRTNPTKPQRTRPMRCPRGKILIRGKCHRPAG